MINIITPDGREVAGTKLTLGGGELETFRGDLRQAGVFGDGRFGYRFNGGYNRSDTYSRSRTSTDGTSLQQEYAAATDEPVGLTRRCSRSTGQTVDPATGAPLGDRDPLKNVYGSGRLDYYLNNGSVLSADGGAAQVQNEVFVTGIGRVQVLKAIKPYARVASPPTLQRLRLLEQPDLAGSAGALSSRGSRWRSGPTSSTWRGSRTGTSCRIAAGSSTAPPSGTRRSTPPAR